MYGGYNRYWIADTWAVVRCHGFHIAWPIGKTAVPLPWKLWPRDCNWQTSEQKNKFPISSNLSGFRSTWGFSLCLYLKFRTSFDRVIISGRKLTFNRREFACPVLVRTVSIVKIRPETAIFRSCTRRTQSSNISVVLSFWRKLSPSSFSFCPSMWFSHPFPT